MDAEISYDLVMQEDMDFAEGTFRISGYEWQVFIVTRGPVAEPDLRRVEWESGATGYVITFPQNSKSNAPVIEQILGRALGVSRWNMVRGPDSMKLR